MAAELVPIKLSVTAGDLYTVWAPRWREANEEWEAFLGRDEDLFAFSSVADLAAFVRTDTTNDLVEHPAWPTLSTANAHRLQPAEERHADLVGVEELLAEKPTEASVGALARTLDVVSSIGMVCDLPQVTRFFNGNPNLNLVAGGIEQFTGRAGRKRWTLVGDIVTRGWDDVLAAIDEIITTPDVDERESARAAAELEQPYEEEETALVAATDDDDGDESGETTDADVAAAAGVGERPDFWEHVGIDPIRVMAGGGTYYTLRCYFDEKPIFLGRNGRISVFPSERTLARYLADEHDHDLSDLSTYDDIRTAATDGSLRVEVIDDNIYVLDGLADDLADGPEAVDREQFELAVEFVRDVGVYSEDDIVDRLLTDGTAIGRMVEFVLEPASRKRPQHPYHTEVGEWLQLERFVESRLRRE